MPSGGATFVRAQVPDTKLADSPIVFEPDRYWLKDSGLQVEESVLHANKDGHAQVLVANPTDSPKELTCGAVVGQVEPFVEVSPKGMLDDAVETVNEVEYQNGGVLNIDVDPNRKEKLKKLLKVGSAKLTDKEKSQMCDCVLEAQNLFALTELEQGEVTGVTHEIDTGESLPIRQAPRCVPFSLRPKIEQMVEEMLEAEVIEESNSPWASPVVLV